MSITDTVRKVLIEALDADPDSVTEKALINDDLGADSLDEVELLFAFEQEFDIEITDEEAEKVQTVGDIIKAIADKLGEPVS